MRKQYIILLLVLITATYGCKKESEGLSTITHYPVFEITGDGSVFLSTGTQFHDPGVKATVNGVEIQYSISSVEGEYFPYSSSVIDPEVPNKYAIVYSATNAEGYTRTVNRNVFLVSNGDFVNSLEGLYIADVKKITGTTNEFNGMKYVMVRKTNSNEYEISDAFAGYYSESGVWLGGNYKAIGVTFTATDISANSFSYGTSGVLETFGGSVIITTMTVNQSAKTISYQADHNTGTYDVTLTQVIKTN